MGIPVGEWVGDVYVVPYACQDEPLKTFTFAWAQAVGIGYIKTTISVLPVQLQ
jgi:hypothetical protein